MTDDPGGDLSRAWSPDGSRIAWKSDRSTGDFEIYVSAMTAPTPRSSRTPGHRLGPPVVATGNPIAFELMQRRDIT